MSQEPPTFITVIEEAFEEHEEDVAAFIQDVLDVVKAGLPERLLLAAKSMLDDESGPKKTAFLKLLVANIHALKQDAGPIPALVEDITGDESMPVNVRAYAHFQMSRAARTGANVESAIEWSEKGLALYGDELDKTGVILVNMLGGFCLDRGRFEEALGYFNRAAKEGRKLTKDGSVPTALYVNIAIASTELGDTGTALDAYKKVIENEKERRVPRGLSVALSNLSAFMIFLDRPENALYYAEKAFDTISEIEDNEKLAMALNNIARANLFMGNMDKAVEAIEQAVFISRSVKQELLNHEINLFHGIVTARSDNPEAENVLGAAIAQCDKVSDLHPPVMMEFALFEYGKLLCEKNDPDGVSHLKRAEQVLEKRPPLKLYKKLNVQLNDYLASLQD